MVIYSKYDEVASGEYSLCGRNPVSLQTRQCFPLSYSAAQQIRDFSEHKTAQRYPWKYNQAEAKTIVLCDRCKRPQLEARVSGHAGSGYQWRTMLSLECCGG